MKLEKRTRRLKMSKNSKGPQEIEASPRVNKEAMLGKIIKNPRGPGIFMIRTMDEEETRGVLLQRIDREFKIDTNFKMFNSEVIHRFGELVESNFIRKSMVSMLELLGDIQIELEANEIN